MQGLGGIDGFVCSWWGINTFEDRAFSKIVKVAGREGFNGTIYYESDRNISMEQIVNELSYVLERYSAEPSFLRIGGKPVIFVYAAAAYNRDPGFWRSVVRDVYNRTGIDAIYIADTLNPQYLEVFDGLHTYSVIRIKELGSTYIGVSKAVKSFGKIWVATVCPGYDDRKIRSPGSFVDRENGAYYTRTWEAALASDPNIIIICTWNEWHEGTEVEPSREYGFRYLEITKRYAEIFKRTRIEVYGEPLLSPELEKRDSDVILKVRNDGDGDAVAINTILRDATIRPDKNIISLPINIFTTILYIPIINPRQSIEIGRIEIPEKEARITISITYYSLSGKAYTVQKEFKLR